MENYAGTNATGSSGAAGAVGANSTTNGKATSWAHRASIMASPDAATASSSSASTAAAANAAGAANNGSGIAANQNSSQLLYNQQQPSSSSSNNNNTGSTFFGETRVLEIMRAGNGPSWVSGVSVDEVERLGKNSNNTGRSNWLYQILMDGPKNVPAGELASLSQPLPLLDETLLAASERADLFSERQRANMKVRAGETGGSGSVVPNKASEIPPLRHVVPCRWGRNCIHLHRGGLECCNFYHPPEDAVAARAQSRNVVYATGFDPDRTTWQHLKDHFSGGGYRNRGLGGQRLNCLGANIVSRGCCRVTFSNPRDADRAVADLHESTLHGRVLSVTANVPVSRRSSSTTTAATTTTAPTAPSSAVASSNNNAADIQRKKQEEEQEAERLRQELERQKLVEEEGRLRQLEMEQQRQQLSRSDSGQAGGAAGQVAAQPAAAASAAPPGYYDHQPIVQQQHIPVAAAAAVTPVPAGMPPGLGFFPPRSAQLQPIAPPAPAAAAAAVAPPARDESLLLSSFLARHEDFYKCRLDSFCGWIRSEDVETLEDLADAVESEDWLLTAVEAGLKKFKKAAFKKAAVAAAAAASSASATG